nr:nucleotide pyrophosphatase/phosphodiesterase family protein [Actinokineospora pegani]
MIPRYGTAALSDVTPSALASLGVAGMANPLAMTPVRAVCLLLVDGLGWELLQRHRDVAPFLAALPGGPITAGFPATTASSLTAIGTGLPPGESGIVGMAFAVGGEVLDALRWHRHGTAVDLRDALRPEDVQPVTTAFERARAAGVDVRVVQPAAHTASGLSRAAFRGGAMVGVHAVGDLVEGARAALCSPGQVFCYAYHADLDFLGHVYGPGSAQWRRQLAVVDRIAAGIAEDLPPGARLLVTADHGMVSAGHRTDLDTTPDLLDGVDLVTGEPRVRLVHTAPGARDDVLATWRSHLGEHAEVRTREEAVAAGWFGPRVSPRVAGRIGDLVVATTGTAVITRSSVEPLMSAVVGQHGSFTSAEQLVPLLGHDA